MLTPALAAKSRLKVFVTPPTKDGFVESNQGIVDSMKDLKSRLRDMREFEIVDKADRADLVLTVLGREWTSRESGTVGGAAIIGSNVIASTRPGVAYELRLLTEVQIGPTYRKAYTGRVSNRGWGDCAEIIAKDLRAWVKANAEPIAALTKRP